MMTGTCADESQIDYVSSQGTDSGTCTSSSPCLTFDYALSVLGSRGWLHILGTTYSAGSKTIVLPPMPLVIDSNHATVTNDGSKPIFATVTGTAAQTTLRALTIGMTGGTMPAISVNMGTVTAEDVHLLQPFSNQAATLVLESSILDGDAESSTTGTTTIRLSTLKVGVVASAGMLTYQRNRFDHATKRAVVLAGATNSLVENSLFISNGAAAPVIEGAGSSNVIRFNTMIDLQPTSATPITCTGSPGPLIQSNIFGWNNNTLSCSVSNSLFAGNPGDTHPGNVVAPLSSVFVSLGGMDFHLMAGSPAIRGGTSGATLPIVDYDGAVRPNPPATTMDIGAYESPN